MSVEGRIYRSDDQYLTRLLFWYPHDCDADAFVHTEPIDVGGWEVAPTHWAPATWSLKEGTKRIGPWHSWEAS